MNANHASDLAGFPSTSWSIQIYLLTYLKIKKKENHSRFRYKSLEDILIEQIVRT